MRPSSKAIILVMRSVGTARPPAAAPAGLKPRRALSLPCSPALANTPSVRVNSGFLAEQSVRRPCTGDRPIMGIHPPPGRGVLRQVLRSHSGSSSAARSRHAAVVIASRGRFPRVDQCAPMASARSTASWREDGGEGGEEVQPW